MGRVWEALDIVGSPAGQQHWVSILGRVLQGKRPGCELNPGAGKLRAMSGGTGRSGWM